MDHPVDPVFKLHTNIINPIRKCRGYKLSKRCFRSVRVSWFVVTFSDKLEKSLSLHILFITNAMTLDLLL